MPSATVMADRSAWTRWKPDTSSTCSTILVGTRAAAARSSAFPGLRWIALLLLIVLGSLSYFGIGQMIGAFRMFELKAALRR